MFDFRFELKWEVKGLEAGPAKGVLVYPDVGQDCDEVYDVDCRVRRKEKVGGCGELLGGLAATATGDDASGLSYRFADRCNGGID